MYKACIHWTMLSVTADTAHNTNLWLVPGHLPPEERVHEVVGHIDCLE